jgi:large subunit ribosomal protein L13
MKYTIDAQGKKVGRVASEAASYLMGKNSTEYARNKTLDIQVEVINCSKAKIDDKKKNDKVYTTYTGFRGGLNHETLGHLIERKGTKEVFERAIYGMLPHNSLKKQMMKNLTLSE